jgi:hypothetical protein
MSFKLDKKYIRLDYFNEPLVIVQSISASKIVFITMNI